MTLVGHHIDHTADGISTESHWHNSLIHLNPVGETHRDVVESE